MGAENMQIARLKHGIGDFLSFYFSTWISGKESSNWFILPAGAKALTITVYPEGSNCFVQSTTDSVQDVITNTNVIGVTWDKGLVDYMFQVTFTGPVTAIRCTQTTDAGVTKFTGIAS